MNVSGKIYYKKKKNTGTVKTKKNIELSKRTKVKLVKYNNDKNINNNNNNNNNI
jgi:hypothetical protein